MGNEMGNNNTTAFKEEDNISEADKKNLLEDTSEHANGTSQDVHADDGVKEENQNIPTSIAKDVMEKASNASNDITIELGKDTPQENGHADDVKGKTQTIPTAEAKDAEEKDAWFASNNTSSMPENDSLEGDSHASDANMENQIMHPTAEAEYVLEKATGLASEDDATTELGEVSVHEEIHAGGVKEKSQMIPTDEANDVQEKATGLISNNTESMVENYSLEGGDTHESDVNVENQVNPTSEAEDVQEKATRMTSDYTRSSLDKDLSKGEEDQEIAVGLACDGKTSELEDKPQEDNQDGNVIILITNGTDVQGKSTILASDDPLSLRNSLCGEGEEMNGVRQPEKSPYAGSVEGEKCESLPSSLLEGTEECGKQEDHHLTAESPIKQDEEETMVLTLNVIISNDSELQESLSVHHVEQLVTFLSEDSPQDTESPQKDTLLDSNSHFQLIKDDDVLEKDMEPQEKLLCTNGRDGNEFGNGLIDTSEATHDPPSIGNNNNGNLLTKVNNTTEDSLNPFPESFVVDNPLKSDHEENCKVLNEENKLSRCGSTKENPHDYKPDPCMKELKEHKYDMTIGSNGDCNGERHAVLDSSVLGISNIDQVEEPKDTENGVQFDAYVNKSNKASDESSAAPEEKHYVVPEAEAVFLIAGSTVVDFNKIEDTYEKPEASNETDMSEQCNSDLVTINGEESFSLQNSASLLHIYNHHQGKEEQTKSFTTATSMPNSATIDRLDSSKLTVLPSLDLVDEEAIEKEREDHSQHKEASSLTGTELTTSAATRDSGTRLSTESNPDNLPNIPISQIQKSPSFNLDLRIEARPEESDQTPLLYQDKPAEDESLSNQTSLNLSNSIMPHAEYEYDQCMLHSVEMPAEEKIVTMERSYYSEESKAPFISLLKEEEEAHLLVMPLPQAQEDHHSGTKKEVKEEVSSTSPKGKEKRKSRSSFFSSCMCCATVAN